MAKLNKELAKRVDGAESSGFEPVPATVYHLRLLNVDPEHVGPAGPYWSWEFEIVGSEDHDGRKLWNNTSLSEAADFKMKESFEAFGVTTDTDTDDLLGSICKAKVSIRTIQSGDRKGELSNQIDRLMLKDDEFVVAEKDPAEEPAF